MPAEFAKQIGEVFKDRDTLVSDIGRHLLKGQESDRRADCIHPSEAASENWCPRATYYRITGAEPDPAPRWLAMEAVFETGNDSHRKYQTWLREMGVLKGNWYCMRCGLLWEDMSPHTCPRCEAGYDLIDYAEVPVSNEFYLLAGQADGDVYRQTDGGPEDTLIEIKTIGTGTLRYDAPKLIEKYTYQHVDEDGKSREYTDWPLLWSHIRRPFPPHLRQGMIYCFCKGRDRIVYIYEPKFLTAYPKEFEIQFRKDLIEDVLDQCLVVKNCLEKQRPPKRPIWAEKKSEGPCKKCPYRSVCYDRQPDRRAVQKLSDGQSGPPQEEPLPPQKARVRFAPSAD